MKMNNIFLYLYLSFNSCNICFDLKNNKFPNSFSCNGDIFKNIKAVKKALDLLDVKGKLYQARVEISNSYTPKTLDTILDENNPDSPVVGKKKLTGEEAKYFGKPKPWYKRILNFRDKATDNLTINSPPITSKKKPKKISIKFIYLIIILCLVTLELFEIFNT